LNVLTKAHAFSQLALKANAFNCRVGFDKIPHFKMHALIVGGKRRGLECELLKARSIIIYNYTGSGQLF
jgi:hypothetical protein